MNLVLLCATVALLPVLVPHGPANTAPVDLFAAGFLLVTVVAVVQRRWRVHVPAPLATTVILAGSLVALVASNDLRTGLLTLLIDVYLLLVLVATVTYLHADERAFRVVLVVWAAAALVWATVLVGAHFHLTPEALDALFQLKPGATRAAGPTGSNPNLAGSYMLTSFFVLLASPWPRGRLARLLAGGWLLAGLWATASLGGLLGLAAGLAVLAVGAYLRVGRTTGQVQGLAGGALLAAALVLAAVLVTVGPPRLTLGDVAAVSAKARDSGALSTTIGRASKSLDGRIGLWSAAIARAGSACLVGVGPGEARGQLQIGNGRLGDDAKVHSLHNDVLAFLIERGVLGLVGLLGLYAALVRRALRVVAEAGRDGVRAQALGAAVIANAADSLFHETLHFRHVIILFALLWFAGDLAARQLPAPEPPEVLDGVR